MCIILADEEELDTKNNQTELPEEGTNRKFMAISTLEVYVNKSHRGKMIRCAAFHESYASKSMSTSVKLDVTCKYLTCFLYRLIYVFV